MEQADKDIQADEWSRFWDLWDPTTISWTPPYDMAMALNNARTRAEQNAHGISRLTLVDQLYIHEPFIRPVYELFLSWGLLALVDDGRHYSSAWQKACEAAPKEQDVTRIERLAAARWSVLCQLRTAMDKRAEEVSNHVTHYVRDELHLPWPFVAWDLCRLLWWQLVSGAIDVPIKFDWTVRAPLAPIRIETQENESPAQFSRRLAALQAKVRAQQKAGHGSPKGHARQRKVVERHTLWLFRHLVLKESIHDLAKNPPPDNPKRKAWSEKEVRVGLDDAVALLNLAGWFFDTEEGPLPRQRLRRD